MTSKHVELAFQKARELVADASVWLPMQALSPSLLETVFTALVNCDDDAELEKKLREAA